MEEKLLPSLVWVCTCRAEVSRGSAGVNSSLLVKSPVIPTIRKRLNILSFDSTNAISKFAFEMPESSKYAQSLLEVAASLSYFACLGYPNHQRPPKPRASITGHPSLPSISLLCLPSHQQSLKLTLGINKSFGAMSRTYFENHQKVGHGI